MGRGQGKKQRLLRKDFKGANRRDNTWDEKRSTKNKFMEPSDYHNEAFEEYYHVQDIVPRDEWQAFLGSLKTPLPITFRINGSGKFANELRQKMESDFFANFRAGPIMLDGEVVDPPRPLPWYPHNLAWHMNFSRNQLRKLSWLGEIHEFMKAANEAGSITRQEAVSMVPPLFMDVRPHHRVLDMCAAPGSKTFQLLEMLHNIDANSDSSNGSGAITPTGFVIANDAEPQRCNLLTHQTKRMCSPCLMVTNHNGEQFPCISAVAANRPPPGNSGTSAIPPAEADGGSSSGQADDVMLFDRILCDVPCSGDGTMRKAPDIWRRWTVNNGNGIHIMQLKIALQAVRLLKVGGRMVYSTCTFNPIENEAVVSELLIRCSGTLELLDVSYQLPELQRCPGKRQWKVRDKHQWYNTWEEAEKDTGGFFVAVLQKVAPTPNLHDPDMKHRFTRIISAGPSGRLIKMEGMDPSRGASYAADFALQAAEQAIAALESAETAAAEKAANATAAAVARAGLALDAAQENYKHAKRYEAQEDKKQQKQRRQQDAAGAAAEDGDAVAAAQEMEGVEVDDDMMNAEQATAEAAADEAAAEEGQEDLPEAGPVPGSDAAAAAATNGGGGAAAAARAEAAADGAEKAAWTPSWVRGGGGRGRAGGGKGRFRGIDPIVPVEDPSIISMLIDFYGVEPDFPLATHLISRSIEFAYPKRLYYVSDALLSLLLADVSESLKITSTGLKLFERHELRGKEIGRCQYRIAQEGLPFLLPHLRKQVLHLGAQDFMRLLTEKNLPLIVPQTATIAGDGIQPQREQQQEGAAKVPSNQAPLTTPAVVQQLDNVESGGAVALLDESAAKALGLATSEDSGALAANAPLAISVWRTRASLSVLVAKNECEQLLDKIKAAMQKKGKQQ
eukprot:GHRR01010001.1.p1 GENE.GHRR01010001.1~~GHRR01010001.1.p1  ORF type:complete len:901 (+),score=384.85 GHRR01010001.1:586-3288(+)